MIFRNFTGSAAVQNQIARFIDEGRLPHAIVLEGQPGAGALTLARDIAAALVCKGEGEKPCGDCPACKKAYAASHPDIFEYVAKDAPKSFPVAVVRQVRSDAYVVANEADYKIYILGNASSMGTEAQNALLKTLEEPPPRVILILTVTSKTLLLDTVLSRSVVFTLEEVEKSYEDKVLPVAAEIGQALISGNEYAIMKASAKLEGDKEGLRELSEALADLFRRAVLLSSGAGREKTEGNAALLSQSLSKSQLLKLLQVTADIQTDLNRNANNTLLLTKLCLSLKQAVL